MPSNALLATLYSEWAKMKSSGLAFLALLAVLVVATPLETACAAITWSGDVDPADPSTWTSSTDGYIGHTADGTLLVDLDSDLESGTGSIGYESSSIGEVTVDGAGSTWVNSNLQDYGLAVGYYGSGLLNISGGGAVSSGHGFIAYASGSTGEVTIDGAGSTWTNSSYQSYRLSVGYYGSGMLNITNGGTVKNGLGFIAYESGSTGEVTVDDEGSTWNNSYNLSIGSYGNGVLNITGGGKVRNSFGSIGYHRGSTGNVIVDGANSTWSNRNNLSIGSYGNGTLIITDGGTVSNGYGYIGSFTGSMGKVTVDGEGSTWINSDNLYVRQGVLNITHGGAVSVAGKTTVEYDSTSTGIIDFGTNGGTLTTESLHALPTQLKGTGTINARGLVSDVDLVFSSSHDLSQTLTYSEPGQDVTLNLDMSGTSGSPGNLGVGYKGIAVMTIRDGCTVASKSGFLGCNGGSTGTATVDGVNSTWNNSNTLYIGSYGNGVLNITGGGSVSSSYGYIGSGISSSSKSMANVVGAGSTWSNIGSLDVGYYAQGNLTISNGGLVSVGETLTIDNDNDGDGFIDMGEGGMLALKGDGGGSIGEFMDLIRGSDALRYWNESTLLWENITTATAGSDYTLEYQDSGDLAGYTLLTVLTDIPLLGDSNLDDCVDVIDLGTLATNYGATTGANWAMGDFNFDGAVDVGDLGILASHYGEVETPSTAAVPEPAMLIVLLSAAASMLYTYRQRGRL